MGAIALPLREMWVCVHPQLCTQHVMGAAHRPATSFEVCTQQNVLLGRVRESSMSLPGPDLSLSLSFYFGFSPFSLSFTSPSPPPLTLSLSSSSSLSLALSLAFSL